MQSTALALASVDTFKDTITCLDWQTLLRSLPDNSVDAVITDPPYGMGLDVWDKPIDIPAFVSECYRVVKSTGFVAVFSQMPYMADWVATLQASQFRYADHIIWAKRTITSPTQPILRSHESILIYRASGAAKYHQTKGRYEDINLPKYLDGLISIEAFDRVLKDLHAKLDGKGTSIKRSNEKGNAYTFIGKTISDRSPRYANLTNVWSFQPDSLRFRGDTQEHPTVKPLEMFERLIDLLSPPGAIVLDPFSGSGTTALAARNTGRHYICGDTSEEYVAIARERLAKPYTPDMFTALERQQAKPRIEQPPLFAGEGTDHAPQDSAAAPR